MKIPSEPRRPIMLSENWMDAYGLSKEFRLRRLKYLCFVVIVICKTLVTHRRRMKMLEPFYQHCSALYWTYDGKYT